MEFEVVFVKVRLANINNHAFWSEDEMRYDPLMLVLSRGEVHEEVRCPCFRFNPSPDSLHSNSLKTKGNLEVLLVVGS